MIRSIALVLAALGVAAAATASHLRDDAPRPNVLLLVMDTTRADRCSFMGYERPTTPRLDEFAKDAVTFRNAWSAANWTGPAHASLFTGIGPDLHGFLSAQRPFLDAERPTMAESLAAAGYATGCFSNNPLVSPGFGLTRGFETIDPLYERVLPMPWARVAHEEGAAWAEAAHAAGKPFFLFINDVEPHQPYEPPAAESAAFVRGHPSPRQMAEARAFESTRSLAHSLGVDEQDAGMLDLLSDLYDAEVRSLDREIGTLLDRLRDSGLLDTTIVVIVGDHGEMLGENGLLDHGSGLHRAVLHVPLLVRFPGAFDAGRVVRDVVRIEDVAPTILELCRLPGLDGAKGISLARDLPGRIARAEQPADNWVGMRALRDFPAADSSGLRVRIQSVHDGRFHLLRFPGGRVALYDVDDDPGERNDLASREPREVERLLRLSAETR